MLKTILVIVIVILFCLTIVMGYRMFLLGKESQQISGSQGLVENRLKRCPDSPNCVSSFDDRDKAYIQPIAGAKPEFDALASIIAEDHGAEIRLLSENYVHAEYKTKLFGFVDDLELLLASDGIYVRSTSRVGYSDLDANRKRLEDLRAQLENWKK